MAKVARITDQKETEISYLFDCPACGISHSCRVGATHPEGKPMWTFNGNLDRPTFHPSLVVRWRNGAVDQVCHSFIRDGRIQFLNDCTHGMGGKTVEIPDLEPGWGDNPPTAEPR
jgi:hypothetical protein